MDIFLGVIVGLLVLMFLVTAHEFGHFLMARRNGVNVLEFGIGFPPKALAWIKDPNTGKWRRLPRKEWDKEGMAKVVYTDGDEKNASQVAAKDKKLFQKGMVFSLNWLPIGGFCQMDGESDADSRKGTFGAAKYWSKTKILFAGVAANWLIAIVIFTILAWTGMPEFLEGQFTVDSDTRVDKVPVQITSVEEGSPAEKAGLKVGEYIWKINGEAVWNANEVSSTNEKHAGEEVTYTIVEPSDEISWDNGQLYGEGSIAIAPFISEVEVELNPADSDYLLGVTMSSTQALSYSTWSAPIVGVGLTAQLTGETFKGVGTMLWNLVSGVGSLFSPDADVRQNGQEAISSVGDSVSGPVGIIGVLFPAFTSAGPNNLAFLTALISVSLACMNVLPIPALDGGRWLLITIYKLRKKKLTKEVEERIVSRAMVVLLALIALVTVLDIIRIAS